MWKKMLFELVLYISIEDRKKKISCFEKNKIKQEFEVSLGYIKYWGFGKVFVEIFWLFQKKRNIYVIISFFL